MVVGITDKLQIVGPAAYGWTHQSHSENLCCSVLNTHVTQRINSAVPKVKVYTTGYRPVWS